MHLEKYNFIGFLILVVQSYTFFLNQQNLRNIFVSDIITALSYYTQI